MASQPSEVVVRSRPWRLALGLTVAAVLVGFQAVIRELVTLWATKADYSHGFLVVPFAGYLLWVRRDLFPARIDWPDLTGLIPATAAVPLLLAADRYNVAKEWLQSFALVLALGGVVVLYFGRRDGLRWAWPALAFLPAAFQLPFMVESSLSTKLQAFATAAGNFVFQLLGLASYAEGNVIVLGDTRLGVDKACGGLSMLLAFLTLAGAIAVLYRTRPVIDRVLLFAAAVPIALVCNVVRISVTGLVYYAGWTRAGDLIVHDLAGWLMMPLALGLLWVELRLIDWVVEPVERVTADVALGLPGRKSAPGKRVGGFNRPVGSIGGRIVTPLPSRRTYAWLAAGFGLFTIYGSLVPFHFVPRPLSEAVAAFGWVLEHRINIQSRSDWGANFLLGGPVAFCLLASWRADRRSGLLTLAVGGAVVLGCSAFAATVEFAQLFFPGRTCSASDIVAQTLGSVAGVALWISFGQTLTNAARRAWADPRAGGAAGRLLVGYAVVIGLVQLLPLDINTSPVDVYRKLRDGPADGRVTVVPFAEFDRANPWPKVQNWLELVGLFLPAGLLLARMPGASGRPGGVLVVGLAAALVTELGQLVVSRHPSPTDVVWGGVGVWAGYAAGRVDARFRPLLAMAWLLVLAVTHWQPFVVSPTAGRVEWVPFADAQAQNYFGALDQVLERLVMFLPVGVLAAGDTRRPTLIGGAAGFGLALALELGQVYLPARTAATTELVTGTVAAAAGAIVAGRLRQATEESR